MRRRFIELVECLEALHRVVVGVFGQNLDPGFENDIITFEETFMGAMLAHNPRMTQKVHALVHHVPECVSRTRVELGPTSEQALESQHRFFDIFNHKFKVNCTTSLVSRERLLRSVLHYNSCHL